MNSIWKNTSNSECFAPLNQDIHTDTLIIGGGMCGLLCAHFLQEAGVDAVLVEAERLCGGITGNTTAKITAQHGLIYHKLIRTFGAFSAKQYYEINEAALRQYQRLCDRIDCEFEIRDSYVYGRKNRKELIEEFSALKRLGIHADYTNKLPLPFPTVGAIRFQNQGQFHPLKFAHALSKPLRIYEHTGVLELSGTTARTTGGMVHAKHIIVATHFPFLNQHGSYFLKLYQHRSYVLALKNAPQLGGMYVDAAQNGLSFRNYQNLLLLGGGSHRTGKQGGNFAELRAFAKRYFPQAEEVFHWATQDCMTLDDIPYIGPYSARTTRLYVSTGFEKWGMTASMVAAMILTDMICGVDNPYAGLFSPSRSILRPQLFINAMESALHLLTPTPRRCPHMGCALKWNPAEHTWDCPCHGSRFTEDGHLIDNPATGDLKSDSAF